MAEPGPPPSQRIAPKRVVARMAKAGYRLKRERRFLPNQYFLVFQLRKEG